MDWAHPGRSVWIGKSSKDRTLQLSNLERLRRREVLGTRDSHGAAREAGVKAEAWGVLEIGEERAFLKQGKDGLSSPKDRLERLDSTTRESSGDLDKRAIPAERWGVKRDSSGLERKARKKVQCRQLIQGLFASEWNREMRVDWKAVEREFCKDEGNYQNFLCRWKCCSWEGKAGEAGGANGARPCPGMGGVRGARPSAGARGARGCEGVHRCEGEDLSCDSSPRPYPGKQEEWTLDDSENREAKQEGRRASESSHRVFFVLRVCRGRYFSTLRVTLKRPQSLLHSNTKIFSFKFWKYFRKVMQLFLQEIKKNQKLIDFELSKKCVKYIPLQ